MATPEQIGPYRIIGELGRGGMGVVYRAVRDDLQREFALKLILPGVGAGPEALPRFLREARAAARLSGHPGIVGVHDLGEVPDPSGGGGSIAYFAMDLVDGAPLDELIDGGDLSPRAAAGLIAQAARAVHHAHTQGILHRDLKPANILVRSEAAGPAQAVVTDFGLAAHHDAGPEATRLTQSGQILGTPAYMPPEQARGLPLDPRADVFALGATLYEACCGVTPFDGDTLHQLLAALLRDEPRPLRRRDPRIPAALSVIAQKCLEKEPDRRYAGADALAADLERFLSGEAIVARPPPWPVRAARWAGRHRVVVGAVAAAVLASGTMAGLLVPRWAAAVRAEAKQKASAEGERAARLAALEARAAARPHLEAGRRHLQQMVLLCRRPEHTDAELERLGALAFADFAEAAQADPTLPEVPWSRARVYVLLRDRPAARRELDAAIALDDGFAPARVDRIAVHAAELMTQGWHPLLGAVTDSPRAEALRAAIREDDAALESAGFQEVERRYADAMLAVLAGEYGRAVAALEEYVKAVPGVADGHARLGIALLRLERFAEARVSLQRALECNAREWSAWLNLAVLEITVGRWEAALQASDRVIALNPGSPIAWVNRAGALTELGRLDAAEAALDRAEQLGRAPIIVMWARTGWLRAAGRLDESHALLTNLLEIRPGWPDVLRRRAALAVHREDYDVARADAEAALAADPSADWPHLTLIAVERDSGDLVAAAARGRRLVGRRPESSGARVELAITLAEAGAHEAALAEFARALALNPDDRTALRWRGRLRLDLGDAEGALADVDRALQLAPMSWPARETKGMALARLGRAAEARDLADPIVATRPESIDARRWQGDLRAAAGDHTAAIESYTIAIRLGPADRFARFNRGNSYRALRRLPEAEADYLKVTAQHPGFSNGWLNLGVVRMSQRRLPQAQADLERALEADPANTAAGLTLASVISLQGDIAGAIARFRQVRDALPAAHPHRRKAEQALRQLGGK